jgi:hypothetical protein
MKVFEQTGSLMSYSKAAFSADSIYQLKISLDGALLPVWRRIQVSGRVSLFKLHQALQIAMGWTDSHLHQFTIHGDSYSIPSEDDLEPVIDERKHALWKTVPLEGMKFAYEYDFGDGWMHTVEVEAILPPDPKFKRPVCLAGERACPPEDIGGIGGYELFLKAIADPDHEEHDSYKDWMGTDFDAEAFDLDEVNAELKRLK